MYDRKKTYLLILGVSGLYMSLTSDKILQNVQLGMGDSCLIIFL
jgi:hypothetical protein